MLEIINLHVEVERKEIIKGISLQFKPDEIHAIMGPNGSGKSTLVHAIMGNPKYKITSGKIILDNQDITNISPEKRAKLGLFLSFQNPPAVSGVTISNFLRTAVNTRNNQPVNVLKFHNQLKENLQKLNLDQSFSNRHLNQGFSGGEKKRSEILQLSTLQPKYAFLDETDSGMDVDGIKLITETISQQKSKMGVIIITHYNKFLEELNPNKISIIVDGKIIQQGGKELSTKIEHNGFGGIINEQTATN